MSLLDERRRGTRADSHPPDHPPTPSEDADRAGPADSGTVSREGGVVLRRRRSTPPPSRATVPLSACPSPSPSPWTSP